MINIKKITEFFEKFEIDNIILKLEEMKDEEIYDLLRYINKNINLINQRKKNNSKQKKEFLNQLKNYFIQRGLKTNFFEAIEFFENSYNYILKKRSDLVENFTSEYILSVIFYHMHELFLEFKYKKYFIIKNAKSQNELLAGIDNPYGDKFFDDNFIDNISNILTNNIIIESWGKWFYNQDDRIILPESILEFFYKPDLIHTNIEFNRKIYENTGLWSIIKEMDSTFRLLEEEIIFEKDKYIKITNLRDGKLEEYALFAREKAQRIMLHNGLMTHQVLGEIDENKILIEAINFKDLLSIDIYDGTEYLGLTIVEWIKTFTLLKSFCYMTDHPVILSKNELIYYFNLININCDKCEKILNTLAFHKNSVDIFDSPIITFENDKYLVIPFGLIAPNFINIISSIIYKRKLSFKDKGEKFEDNCFYFFKKMEDQYGYRCTSPYLKINDDEYQIDVLLEWDDYIFIIECKNRSIPNTLANSLYDFRERMDEYSKQLMRFLNAIVEYPHEFKLNITNKKIVPVILNSLPFSLDYEFNGIVFTDFSVVNKFFDSKNIYLQVYGKDCGKINVGILHEQWESDLPNAFDFYKNIKSSYYIKEARSRLNIINTEHIIDGKIVVFDRKIMTGDIM